jgi:hypothetical protein
MPSSWGLAEVRQDKTSRDDFGSRTARADAQPVPERLQPVELGPVKRSLPVPRHAISAGLFLNFGGNDAVRGAEREEAVYVS